MGCTFAKRLQTGKSQSRPVSRACQAKSKQNVNKMYINSLLAIRNQLIEGVWVKNEARKTLQQAESGVLSH
jgi:hypothetical protein